MVITSLQNEKVKLARSLQTGAKARRKAGKMVLEGARLVRDALQSGQRPDFVLLTPDAENEHLLEDYGVDALPVSDDVMRHITETQQPQGILGIFPLPHLKPPLDPQRILILDSIRDPGNLGTILRTSAAAGVELVLLSPTCVDPYNPKVLRGGMGAHFRVPVIETNWEQISEYRYNRAIYVADSQGNFAYDAVDWMADWALIIGGEADGAGTEALALAQSRVYIPMAAQTESLNAAVAAGVILFEAKRQRDSA
jgi:TrmH family RNA methyltransferase